MIRQLSKKIIFTAALFIFATQLFAFNYEITFSASGASTTVGDVVVYNSTLGTTITVPEGNTLRLTDEISAVNAISEDNKNLKVVSNGISGLLGVSFFANQSGIANITLYNLNGIVIAQTNTFATNGINNLEISLSKGVFLLRIAGNGYVYNTKVIGQKQRQTPSIIPFYDNGNADSTSPQKSKTGGITYFRYLNGNKITLKANSGVYFTTIIDSPTESKNINFNFDICVDADGKNYPTVKIGNQVWMAENLSSSKYQNGELIPYVESTEDWGGLATAGWANFDNLVANGTKFGHLYNWYAVKDTRNIAPVGWHVANDADWDALSTFLISNGYNYDGNMLMNQMVKSLAANTDWATSGNAGAIGNNLALNNASGFNALPSGARDVNGDYLYRKSNNMTTFWWSATEIAFDKANSCSVNYYWKSWYRYAAAKANGYSVRCVKD